MKKEKLSKTDREELDEAVVTLRRALADALAQQQEDDKCQEAAKAASENTTIAEIARRDGTAAGILAARQLGRRGGPQG